MPKGTEHRGGSAGPGLVTAASTAVTGVVAAVIGVLIARYFGRDARTDGFFAAYAVYLVLLLAAGSARVVVLPGLARSRAAGFLAAEAGGYAVAFAVVALPVLVIALAFPGWLAGQLTASDEASEVAAEALVWLAPAAVAQLFAGLAASVLAAVDSYGVAALGFALGSVGGLVTIVLLEDHGLVAVSWGVAVNGGVSLGVPLLALAALGRTRTLQAPAPRLRRRLVELAEGITFPLALQALVLVALRSAGALGVGQATSFSYAYLIASSLVAVAATSLALVITVPLTRRGLDPDGAHEPVVHVTWLSLAPIAGVVGAFALAGEPVLRRLLGPDFAGEVGSELGRLVVYLAPWTIVSVGVTVTFPLMFVAGRGRWLPVLGAAALAAHLAIDAAGRSLLELAGIALALAVTTGAAFAVQLRLLSPRALAGGFAGVAWAALVSAGLAAAAFGLAALVADGIAAAALGLAVYGVALAAWRPPGLRRAWGYLVALR